MPKEKMHTIEEPATGIYREKGSKFIGLAQPIKSEVELDTLLDEIRADHAKSKHICYAYRMGPEGKIFRYNDADEPKNSAGLPILNQLRSAKLTDVLLVVVRYFGGKKLGLSGLTAAYKEAAIDTIDNAELKTYRKMTEFGIRFPYNKIGEVNRILESNKVQVVHSEYEDPCRFELSCEFHRKAEVLDKLAAVDGLESV